MDRREFIKRAGSSTLGAALVLQGTTIISAQVRPPILFAYGTVVSLQGDMIYAANDKGPIKFRLTGTSDIWKGKHGLSASALAIGDSIDATGEIDFDAAIKVRQLYANIVNFY